jgi:hypothetical protein
VFDSRSRYASVTTQTFTVKDAMTGETRTISYKARRRLPARGAMPTLARHVVRQGDRLDNVTARYLADPTQFWQVCDANVVSAPTDLTSESGRVVDIPLPGIG